MYIVSCSDIEQEEIRVNEMLKEIRAALRKCRDSNEALELWDHESNTVVNVLIQSIQELSCLCEAYLRFSPWLMNPETVLAHSL